MRNIITLFILIFLSGGLNAQSAGASFIDFQRAFANPNGAMKRKEDTLRKQFEAKGLVWPAKFIYIRSFKYDGHLEIWVKNDRREAFKLFKTYRICALAGTLGPKRMAGDYQVPEGFYYINEFKPHSNYHLALGINYPNASDRLLSDSLRPGGDIYIHGSCVTVGCIPLTDDKIEEVYLLAAYAKNLGQDFIPVHIFPIRYDVKRSVNFLATLTKTSPQLNVFAMNLKKVFDHFELTRQIPPIMVNASGDYIFEGLAKAPPPKEPAPKPKRARVEHRYRQIDQVAEAVNEWPQFADGGNGFLTFLAKTGKRLLPSLPEGMKKAYVVVEFIVDRDGTPTNFKVVKGVNEEFDDELVTEMEKMPLWRPALLNNKPVPKAIKQGFAIE
ncbi:energy transducer TonB [Paraflavisolibacter sp. H34]|uniref:L,D-transpeptidase family protein n=1 Tax=Huijunlia imazamoxiresistens TaxID=3127457 RepID=UPI0030196B71